MIGDIIIESRMTRTSRISLFRSFHLLLGVKTSRNTGGHGRKGVCGRVCERGMSQQKNVSSKMKFEIA